MSDSEFPQIDDIATLRDITAASRDLYDARRLLQRDHGPLQDRRLDRAISRLKALGAFTPDPQAWAVEVLGGALVRGAADITASEPAPRWAATTDRELGLLIGGLESAERDGTIDHAGKALHAELEQELARRVGETT